MFPEKFMDLTKSNKIQLLFSLIKLDQEMQQIRSGNPAGCWPWADLQEKTMFNK